MVQFNTLEFLTPKTLHINAEIQDIEYFENVYIDQVVIDTESTVGSTGPSDKPVITYTIEEPVKSINIVLDVSEAVKERPQMLFVYVRCTGTPSADTPCGLDEEYDMKAVVDYTAIYNYALKLAKVSGGCKCSSGDCEIDVVFANFALQYFRMEKSLENEDYDTAYEAYCYLINKGKDRRIALKPKGCGCNG